jgi:hypothetical protein
MTTAFFSSRFVQVAIHGPGSDLKGLVKAEMVFYDAWSVEGSKILEPIANLNRFDNQDQD